MYNNIHEVHIVNNYYIGLWGPPSRTASFRISEIELEIWKWNSNIHPEEVAFYITCGLSNHRLKGYGTSHRLEFFMGLIPEEDRIVESLATLAVSTVLDKLEVGENHTMTFPEALWAGTRMQTLLVTRPDVEIVPPLKLDNELHVEFMQAIPLFPSELQIKKEKGADFLFEQFREHNVPFWDPNRSSSKG